MPSLGSSRADHFQIVAMILRRIIRKELLGESALEVLFTGSPLERAASFGV